MRISHNSQHWVIDASVGAPSLALASLPFAAIAILLNTLAGMEQTQTPSDFSSNKLPSEYGRRVLLAVSGLSPQIVTETLYALAKDPLASFVPTEVHLITTREGAQRAELSLLSEDLGWFHRFCEDYNLSGISFTRQHIHIMRDARNHEMDDIRSLEDNRAAADFITAKVREFSLDPDTALHVSIAGGRKTMGFYLGYALSLFGRPQDRLSHVLVSEPFENSIKFFYPTPYSRTLQTHDGSLADSSLAEITLAEIPFVSLRNDLPKKLLSGDASFNETVTAAQVALAPPELVIDLGHGRIRAGGEVIDLPPAELALLAVYARQIEQGGEALFQPKKGCVDMDWADRYMREYRTCNHPLAKIEVTENALKAGMDADYFSQRKSKLERSLKAALGPAAAHYLIQGVGNKRPRRYALTLPKNAVRFATVGAIKGGNK